MTRIPRAQEELQSALGEQLAFLEASSLAFDAGFTSEAKRLAVTIRVLVHDAGRSRSLLRQLGLKSGKFYDSALDLQPSNLATHSGLVMTAMKRGSSSYVAMLDGMPFQRWTDFNSWWSKPVFVDDQRKTLTREKLVLTMANQDGGTHVDPALDEIYHRLTRQNSMGWMHVSGATETPLPDPAGPSVRQIAHELLKSLKADYAKMAEFDADLIIGGEAVFDSPYPPGFVPKVGRNEPCPCGSGRKYKKCHGAAGAS